MISKKGNIKSFFIASLATLFLSISFVSLILGRYILNDRWYYITNILLSIPLSVSILILSNIMSKKIYKSIVLLVFLIILAFTNIANNSLITPNTYIRYTFIKTEIIAASYVTKNNLGQISSDFYTTNPSSGIFQNIFNIDNDRILSLDDSLFNSQFAHDNSIKFIRKDIIHNPFMVKNGIWRLTYDPNKLLIDSGFDRIYDNGGVWAYR
jgi:hypothetical protein